MRRRTAAAKINLALVVGPLRADGKHEVATVLQRIDLHDRIAVSAGERLRISGFAEDTIVAAALQALAATSASSPPGPWRSPSRFPSQPASAAVAPTPRPRCFWQTSCSRSLSSATASHELARDDRGRRAVLPRQWATARHG